MEGTLVLESAMTEIFGMETGALGPTTQAVMWKEGFTAKEGLGGLSTSATRYAEMGSISSTMTVMTEITRMGTGVTQFAKWREAGDALMEPLGEKTIAGSTLHLSLTTT